MNELIDNILRAAAIPVLIAVGIGNIYIIRLMRQSDVDSETKQEENPNNV